MVIGTGLLGNTFQEYKHNNNILIFASGVSNSNETDEKNFEREKHLLLESILDNQDKTLVYFSSCDVMYAQNINKNYYFHKLEMETLIQKNTKKYYIFRLPQIIGHSSNQNSLINFFIRSISEDKKISVWKYAYKNLIDIEDVSKIVKHYIDNDIKEDSVVNLINPYYYSIEEIIKTIEVFLDKKAIIDIIDKGFQPSYDYNHIIDDINIDFNNDYLKQSIFKNYDKILNKK
ncbi:MAG: Unknown protein [uncultured Sulfurovum sp.]|uniref:NAD-dependent epimerase/dehydratase domain-containing protein n=1 Tax=uncultured Sulfurovum sp. TaxID=269237 RepID=A0A6S6SVU9_9BACT|nr:MAG: Unknown protein [uncultured Sulfurovum sp.]